VIGAIPEAKEEGLEQFCEFIEDCEFPDLSCKILQLLGSEGPRTPNPAKYIRFIFNRVILETAVVRAAAVSSLAAFGVAVPALLHNIIVLLKRCLNDNDDEVRDRVIYHLQVLQSAEIKTAEELMSIDLHAPLPVLEASLQAYITASPKVPFNVKKHLVEVPEEPVSAAAGGKDKAERKEAGDDSLGGLTAASAGVGAGAVVGGGAARVVNPYLEVFSMIPEFGNLGPLFRSTQPVQLTEEESEYQVNYVKHIYPRHVIFQFNVTNNMEDQQLENVSVAMNLQHTSGWEEELLVPEAKIAHGVAGACFVCLQRPDSSFSSGTIPNELKFEVREVDNPGGDTTEDSYQLEDVEVAEKDFVSAAEPMGLIEFKRQWEALGEAHEQVKKYSLGLDSLQAAVDAVIGLLGLSACEDSASVPDDKRSHAVNLHGTFIGDIPVLCRAGFMLDQKHGVSLKIAVRSTDANVAALLSQCIR